MNSENAHGVLVRANRFTYDQNAATNEALLVNVDECAKGDLAQCNRGGCADAQKSETTFAFMLTRT